MSVKYLKIMVIFYNISKTNNLFLSYMMENTKNSKGFLWSNMKNAKKTRSSTILRIEYFFSFIYKDELGVF